MPSDSIAGFLDNAQANKVLFPEQIEQLIRQPGIPQSNLMALCAYLEQRGVLTRFQASALRDGRVHDLTYAGYPILDESGPCAGGVSYRALHPSLRTPLTLRRFRTEQLAPMDTAAGLVQRARSAAGLTHPHLITPLDAGFHLNEPYAAIDFNADAADLDSLVKDIGPMPGFLAAEFARQTASGLRAAHERGLIHGDVRPATVRVGPLISKTGSDGSIRLRPAPTAIAKLAELGLTPIRPPASVAIPPVDAIAYLPPERVDAAGYTPRGDLYGLGATLYYLLTGRAPFAGGSPAEMLEKVRSTAPASLKVLRPDIPPDLVALVGDLMAKRPEDRPASATDVDIRLQPFCRPGSPPLASAPRSARPLVAVPHPSGEAVPDVEAQAEEWGVDGGDFTSHAEAAPVQPRKLSAADKKRRNVLIVLGLCLHMTAVGLFIAYVLGAFNSSPDPTPTPHPKKETLKKKPKTAMGGMPTALRGHV